MALVVYAGTRMYATIGPSRAVATADGRLFLLSHGRIHEFGPDGARRRSMDLAAAGAPPRPSDFERHADGRILVTNPDAPELLRCAWPEGPCERIPVDLRSLPAQEVLPLNAAKLHIDEAGGRYFISDNAGHKVLVTDFSGKLLGHTRPGQVRHPNQLSLAAPDRLVVVDTDHRRLATFHVLDNKPGSVLLGMSTDARGVARPGRHWPFDSVRLPDGGVAVLVATVGMKNADLVFYDRSGIAQQRAELGGDSDPFDAELWRGRIWVAEATRYRLVSVALDGSPGPALEDSAFLAELEAERAAIEEWKEIRRIAQFAIVVVPLLGALLMWRLGERPLATAVPAPAPSDGVRWFEPNPAIVRRVRRLVHGFGWAFLVSGVALCALVLVRYRDGIFSYSGVRQVLPVIGLMAAIFVAMFATIRAIPAAFASLRIGIAPDELHAVAPGWSGFGSRRCQARWADVYFDGTRLLAGRQMVVIKVWPWGMLVPPDALAALAERVPGSNRLSPGELGRIAMKAGALNAPAIVAILGVIVLILLSLSTRLL